MKLLIDANLSWRLASLLKAYFKETLHVRDTPLNHPARDIDIWNYAKQYSFTIVTNDEDFMYFANVKGFPPKIILLRLGNLSTQHVCNIL